MTKGLWGRTLARVFAGVIGLGVSAVAMAADLAPAVVKAPVAPMVAEPSP